MSHNFFFGQSAELDPAAARYIRDVQAADGAGLESGVKRAINKFVIGCKRDGTWDAIKSSCILAGARTLSGALIPLKGAAPTNFNFVSDDYNRKTGLVGNGSTKYLLAGTVTGSGIANDNNHTAVFASTTPVPSATSLLIGCGSGSSPVSLTGIWYRPANVWDAYNQGTAVAGGSTTGPGFAGVTRNNSSSYLYRAPGDYRTITSPSSTLTTGQVTVFAFGTTVGPPTSRSAARIAFYSIGESVDLANLDTRISALITALGVAI